MRKRVIVHGKLKELWGDRPPYEIVAETPFEAVKGFLMQSKIIVPEEEVKKTPIRVIGYDTIEELLSPTDEEEIHLIPDFMGGDTGKALLQIGIGAALIAASFYMPATWSLTVGAAKITASGVAFNLGTAAILGGLLQLISPAPKLESGGQKKSFLLGSPKNTVAIGTPIPILYGEHKVYGHFLSFDIDATNVAANN